MPANPIHPRGTPPGRGPARAAADVAAIQGSFTSPKGRQGTMSGSVRVERIIDLPETTALEAVFTGHLVDADGMPIGVGSRRRQVPATVTRGPGGTWLSVGPTQVDLLGLTVSVPAFTVPTGDVWTPDGAQWEAGR